MKARAIAILATSLAGVAHAQRGAGNAAEVQKMYAKKEVRITMRDGTQLFTADLHAARYDASAIRSC